MFISLLIYNLKNSEFIQYFDFLLELIQTNDPERLKIKELFLRLQQKFQLLASVFKPERGSGITPQLQEADERRDAAVNGIIASLEADTYHFNPERSKAARLLLNAIDVYGRGIARLNYHSETSTVESIANKLLQAPENVDALKFLDKYEWVEELKDANMVFRNYYLDRLREDSESPEIRIKEVRKEMVELHRLMLNQIEAFSTISSDEVYPETVRSINRLIERYNQMVLTRQEDEDPSEETNAEQTTEDNN